MDTMWSKDFGTGNADGQACVPGRAMSRLAKVFVLLVSLIGLGTWNGNAYAAACTSLATGDWSSPGTWSCGAVPGALDTVTVAATHTVTLTANAAASTLTIAVAGTGGNGVILNGFALAITNAVTMNAPSSNVTSTFNVGAGTLTAASIAINGGSGQRVALMTVSTGTITTTGSITFAGTVGNAQFVSTGASMVNVGGNFGSGGTLTTGGTGTINFNGGAAQTIGAYATYNNIAINNTAGGVALAGNATIGGTLSVNTGTLTVGAFTLAVTGATTVNSAISITSTTGTKTFTGNVTINSGGTLSETVEELITYGGDVTINNGGTLTEFGAATMACAGNLQNDGTYTASTGVHTFSGAAKTFGGANPVVIPSVTVSGTYQNNGTLTVATALAGAGTLTNGATGTLNLGGTSAITTLTASAAGNVVNYTGAADQTVKATTYDTLNFSGAGVKTNSGIVTVNTALTGTALTNAAAGTLNIGGTSTITTLTATAPGNTVNYTGAAQTVKATAYSNLGLGGSGTKTLTGVSTIGGNFTMSGTATATAAAALTVGGNFTIGTGTTFTAGNFNHTVSGNFDATGTFTAGAGTVILNGATAQTISGTNPVTFNNLTVTNAANPNITLATNVVVNGTLTGTVTLTSTCPTDYTLTSTTPAQTLHSCPLAPANFDCVETGLTYMPNPVAPARNPLYTKLDGTPFSFDVVALKADGTVETTYASAANKNVTVELVAGSGATACASRARLTPPVSQTLTFTAADQGRKTTANMTVNKVYDNLRCRVTDANQVPSVVGCSVDNFSVRPVSLTLTATGLGADATGVSTTATPVVKAGANFMLTATASDAGYTGTPTLDNAQLVAHAGAVRNGTLAGVFSAAVAGVASGAAFAYDDVGYFKFNANDLLDATFTAVDSAVGDCTPDFFTTLTGGQYGCKIGSAATSYFGRFIPDHFDLTLGSITAADASGGFSYLGEPFGVSFTLTAKNASGNPTQNYVTANGFAKFDPATASWPSAGLGTNSSFGLGAKQGTADLSSRLAVSGTPSGTWALGEATITANLIFSRPASTTADATWGPYETLDIGVAPQDADGVQLLPGALDLDADSSGTSERMKMSNTTRLRFGRLRLVPGQGSELNEYVLPVEAQYWNGAAWITNRDDGHTTFTMGNVFVSGVGTGPSSVAAVKNGFSSIRLGIPSARGTATICLDLGATTGCNAGTPGALEFLGGNWSDGAFTIDPSAVVHFGRPRPDSLAPWGFIYQRENF